MHHISYQIIIGTCIFKLIITTFNILIDLIHVILSCYLISQYWYLIIVGNYQLHNMDDNELEDALVNEEGMQIT